MAELKVSEEFLLRSLFGNCNNAYGLSLTGAVYDHRDKTVVLCIEGTTVPKVAKVQALFTQTFATVEFKAV